MNTQKVVVKAKQQQRYCGCQSTCVWTQWLPAQGDLRFVFSLFGASDWSWLLQERNAGVSRGKRGGCAVFRAGLTLTPRNQRLPRGCLKIWSMRLNIPTTLLLALLRTPEILYVFISVLLPPTLFLFWQNQYYSYINRNTLIFLLLLTEQMQYCNIRTPSCSIRLGWLPRAKGFKKRGGWGTKQKKWAKHAASHGKGRISWQCGKVSRLGAAPVGSLHGTCRSTPSPSVPVYYDLAGARAALCGVKRGWHFLWLRHLSRLSLPRSA